MINMYIKPVMTLGSGSFGLYMLENGIVNVANFAESTRHPYYGNMMGWGKAVERYTVSVATEEDIDSEVPVFSIGIDDENRSVQFIMPINMAAKLCPIFPTLVQNEEKEVTGFNKITAFEEVAKQRKRAL